MSFFEVDRVEDFLSGHLRTYHESPVPIWAGFIIEQLERILSDQEILNAAAAKTVELVGQIAALLAAKQVAAPGLDFTAENAALASLQALVPAAPAPEVVPVAAVTANIPNAPEVAPADKPADIVVPPVIPVAPADPSSAPAVDVKATAPDGTATA